jgi:hypothetical protein
VTLAVPELVSVRGAVTVLPTSGDPKLRVAGAAVIAPRVVPVEATWAPTPDSEMDAVSFAAAAAGRPRRRTWLGVDREALLVSEITPARVPLARGAKVTLKFRVWPGSRVAGNHQVGTAGVGHSCRLGPTPAERHAAKIDTRGVQADLARRNRGARNG